MRIFLSALLVVLTQTIGAQTDVPGCTFEIACNYDPAATVNDGTCDFISCLVLGCTDAVACNYNPAATVNDGSCDYLSCLVPGCTLANACNYDPDAEVNDGSCEYTSCAGCTNEFADNYDSTATVDDGSCNPIEGCTSPQACNFDANANQDDGSCDFVSCLATGCTVLEACNYDEEAQVNDGTCVFPEEGRDCDGNCLEDADGDNVCDGDEIAGCTSTTALNYNPIATDDDGSCQEPIGGCTDPEACNFDAAATNDDGSCEFTSCAGCLQATACNYDETATDDDGSCYFGGDSCDDNNYSTTNDIWSNACVCEGTSLTGCSSSDFVEYSGHSYAVITIGNQCWFAENCRYLPEVSPPSEGGDSSPHYYVYEYEGSDVGEAKSTSNYETYGVLYNWPAVMTDSICPSGWHVPSDDEFTQLTDYLGGENGAGGKMKEAGFDHWNSPNTGATNSSGWTGLPGGSRFDGGGGFFWTAGDEGLWWSSSADPWETSTAHARILLNNSEDITDPTDTYEKNKGYSVRCVRDAE